jgi:diguanylate cyclase (GGDEF)-like protein/PAS domain S-box-containing protein
LPRGLRNVIDRKAAEDALFLERERAQVTLDSIGDAVLSTDIAGTVTYLNSVAERMTGWSREEARGRPLGEVFRLVDGTTRQPPARNPMAFAIKQNRPVGLEANSVLVRRDGLETAIEDSAAPIHGRDGNVIGAVMVFHDVSESQAVVAKMSHLAQHDFLTDLPNPVLLNDRITQAIALARRYDKQLAVAFMDLDHFKRINDSLGHAVGDELLQSVALRLKTCVRSSDAVSRKGGDEFVVLLSEITHAEDASRIADKIIAAVAAAHQVAGQELLVTTSIGISIYPLDGTDAETLLKSADAAMYQAKKNGRNRYRFFRQEMNSRAAGRRSLPNFARPVRQT